METILEKSDYKDTISHSEADDKYYKNENKAYVKQSYDFNHTDTKEPYNSNRLKVKKVVWRI